MTGHGPNHDSSCASRATINLAARRRGVRATVAAVAGAAGTVATSGRAHDSLLGDLDGQRLRFHGCASFLEIELRKIVRFQLTKMLFPDTFRKTMVS